MVIYCMDLVLLELMFKKTIKKLLSVYECFTCVYVCVPYVGRYLQRPEANIRSPGIKVIDVCEPYYGC